MTRTLILSPEAVAEFDDVLAYIAARNPVAATRLRQRVEGVLEALAVGRFHGREVHLQTGEVVHRWVAAPLVIYYQRTDADLRVARILHGTRAPIEA